MSRKVDRTRICHTCGKTFQYRNLSQKACSIKCRQLRLYKQCVMCGKTFWARRQTKKTCSEKCRFKAISERLKNHPIYRIDSFGNKNSNWRGGVSFDPAQKRLNWKQKKAKRKQLGGVLSIKTVRTVFDENISEFGVLTCYYCRRIMDKKEAELEHIIPLSRGGTNDYFNLIIVCHRCNSSKNNKTVQEWKNHNINLLHP